MSISGRNGSISCVGDTITYTCNVTSFAHIWKVTSLDAVILYQDIISRGGPNISNSQFSIIKVADDGTSITTELIVTSFSGLNGTNVTCTDSTALLGEGEVQQTLTTIFGELECRLHGACS